MHSFRRTVSIIAILGASVAPGLAQNGPDPLASIPLRSIGPAITGGRISDIAVLPGGNHSYFLATASGGLWRTDDAGITWRPLFDRESSYAIGVVEVAPSDPDIVYVGTGENNAQRSVAYGDGVYRSDDGGATWSNIGLRDSGHIGQIWVHPDDPDTVLVAAQGPLWSPGGDRGLYKTTDGGGHWEKILHIDENTGVNEFVVHPDDPDRIVASTYQRRRHVWTLINGGPGSGVHVTDDGGETWQEVRRGLPKAEMGRIGLAMAPSRPDTVYAIIETDDEEEGVYRSSTFGKAWEKRSSFMTTSPQYYNEIAVDPADPERLYAMDTFTSVSEDGGKTFTRLSAEHRHVDDHAIWIDPANTAHLLIGGDGGLYESYDRGQNWRHIDNLSLTQFYRIQPDNDFPFYNVCGGTQDNNSLCGPSRTAVVHGITNADWTIILGGDGYKPQIDPEDPNIIYTQYQYGGLARYDRRTGERLYITPRPPSGEDDYKWNWNTPLLISPHDPKTIYYAAEKVFRSTDRGNSWEIISPDLTRGLDRNALDVMGRVWSVDSVAKNDSTSMYGSIIALSESPLVPGLLFVGTDDGVVSVSEDGGAHWRSMPFIPGVPDQALVEDIITSQHDPDTAYAVFDHHKMGDYAPYVFKTEDRGRSWQPIGEGLPARGSAHTIAEDHEVPGLLFVGTEFGLFFSRNDGESWHEMTGGMPTIAVRDLEIQRRENDLVIGTFGRGAYILDDYSPLREPKESLDAEAFLFAVKDPWLYVEGDRWGPSGGDKASRGDAFYTADNPPFGAVFTYHLRDGLTTRREERTRAEAERLAEGMDTPYPSWADLRAEEREEDPAVIFEISDAEGAVIRRITAPHGKGLHRAAWDLRHEAPDPVSLEPQRPGRYGGGAQGPLVAPGTYAVQMLLRQDGREQRVGEPRVFTVKALNRSPEAADDREGFAAYHQRISQVVSAVAAAQASWREIGTRIDHVGIALDRTPKAGDDERSAYLSLRGAHHDASMILWGDRTKSRRNEPSPLGLGSRTASLRRSTWGSLAPPAKVHEDSLRVAEMEYDELRGLLTQLDAGLTELERQLTELGAPYLPGDQALPDLP